jgi:hypothetical protein
MNVMKVGDLVKSLMIMEPWCIAGLILETGVNMWGEELNATGIRVLWNDGSIEIVPEDELGVIS